MGKGRLEKREQSKLKGLSAIISIFAALGRIGIHIAIVVLILCTICIYPFLNRITVEENSIQFNINRNSITLEKTQDDTASLYANDHEDVENIDIKTYNIIKDAFDKYSTRKLTGYGIAIMLITIAYLYLINLVLKHLGRLFKNIKKGSTPFTLDNVDHMKKMGVYMILAIIFPLVTSIMFKLFTDIDLNIHFGLIDITQILFVLAMSFVFRYGYNLQQDSSKKIYDED